MRLDGLLRKWCRLFNATPWGSSRDTGGKFAGFLLKAVAGLLDTVFVINSRDGGGETAEGDNKVMGDAEGRGDPSKR